jgi:hypothetical protein
MEKITPAPGHKQLTQDQLELIQRIREQGNQLKDLISMLSSEDVDHRWLAIGTADLQKGLMSLVRSVAKPEFF